MVGKSIQASNLANEVNSISKIVQHSSQISDYWNKAKELSNTYEVIESLSYSEWTSDAAEQLWNGFLDKAQALEKAGSGVNIFNFFGIGTVFSVGIGAYCTHSFCENLLNKFAEYYRKNADKIVNSYDEVISYFS